MAMRGLLIMKDERMLTLALFTLRRAGKNRSRNKNIYEKVLGRFSKSSILLENRKRVF
jgi:hypothetical protein